MSQVSPIPVAASETAEPDRVWPYLVLLPVHHLDSAIKVKLWSYSNRVRDESIDAASRVRMRRLTLAPRRLAALGAGGALTGNRLGGARRDHSLPRSADDHPAELVLGRPGNGRARIQIHASRLQQRAGTARDPAPLQPGQRHLSGDAAALHPQLRRGLVARKRSPRPRRLRIPRRARTFPLPARLVRSLPGGFRRRHRRAGEHLPEERVLHRRLLHLQHQRRTQRSFRRPQKGAAQNRQSCAASRSAGPTNTTTATRASRSHSPVFPTANTGSGP